MSNSEGRFGYCANDKCRLYCEAAFIGPLGVKIEEGRLATTCRSCNVSMKQLNEDDRKNLREDPDYLLKKERGEL